MRKLLRITVAGLLIIFALLALTLALPVTAWRRGEPSGPRLHTTVAAPGWPRPLRLWVDTDAACGAGRRTDPDDCFALLLLAQSPEVELVGVSTVFGNAALEVTDSITRALVEQLPAGEGKHVPVVRGAPHGSNESAGGGSAGGTEATAALRRALEEGPLVILALGPLTNLAALFRDRPELQDRVSGVVAVMGRRRGHLFHPVEGGTAPSVFGHGPVFRDFNFAKDPAAAALVLDLELPLTLLPYEAAREIAVGARDLKRMTDAGGAARWVAERARGWLEYWASDIGREGFFPFDLVAAAYVVRPDLVRCATVEAWVGGDPGILGWLGRRGLFVRPPGVERGDGEPSTVVRYCPDLAAGAADWLVDRLLVGRLGDSYSGSTRPSIVPGG